MAYYCWVHPDVTKDEPGECWECGLDLVGKTMEWEEVTTPWDSDEFHYGKWAKKGEDLARKQARSNWDIGDWLLEGEPHIQPLVEFEDLPAKGRRGSRKELRRCGIGSDVYTEAERITGMERNTLRDLASTARRCPASVRTDAVDWSQHRWLVNLLPDADESTYKQWLDQSVKNNYTLREFKEAIRKSLPPKEPTRSKSFRVTVPLRTYEALFDIARGKESTFQKVASDILEQELDTPERQADRTIQKEIADQRLHDRRSEVARKWVMKNDPLGLQQGKEYDH